MSNAIFPTIPSQGWSVFKTPNFSTLTQVSASGKEVRAGLWANPTWDYKLTWEIIKDGNGPPSDIDTFMDWFLRRQGSYDSFLFSDPTDNAVTGQLIGYGDGGTKSFQLSRSLLSNGFAEAIQNPNIVSAIYLSGSAQSAFSYSAGNENLLTYSQALANAAWFHNSCTATDNVIVAPDGTTTADSVVSSATNAGVGQDNPSLGFQAGDLVTFSIWLKVASGTAACSINLQPFSNGIVGSTVVGQALTATTSWQRFTVTTMLNDFQTGMRAYLNINASGQTVHAWGAQLERWNGASGYIPTTSLPLQPNGQVTFGTAPTSGTPITADFSFYFRVRFKNDMQEFENFLSNLWNAKTVELRSVKL